MNLIKMVSTFQFNTMLKIRYGYQKSKDGESEMDNVSPSDIKKFLEKQEIKR